MRGFPLLNLFAVALLLLAVAIPLLRMNSPVVQPALPKGTSSPGAGAVPVTVLLRFADPPQEASVSAEGQLVALRGTGLERQASLPLPLRDGALEFEIKATWPAGTGPSMIEFRVAPEGMAEQWQNLWSDGGAVEEWVRLTWRKPT